MEQKKSKRTNTMRERTSVKKVPMPESSEQQRAKTKKNWAVLIAVVLLLMCTMTALSLTVFFNISKIEVAAFEYYTAQEIREASGIQKGENLFLLSEKDVQNRLRSVLPYVGEVKIKRKLPSTIELTIEPAKATYAFQDMYGSYTLTEESYRVLEKYAPKIPKNCIAVIGTGVSEESKLCKKVVVNSGVETVLQTLLTTLESYQFKDITSMDLSEDSNIQIVYEDRIVLKIGSQANLDYKIKCAQKALQERYQDSKIEGILDLSLLTGDGKNLYFKEQDIHSSVVPESGNTQAEDVITNDSSVVSEPKTGTDQQ